MSRQRINKFLQLALFAVVAFAVVNFTTITAFASGSGTQSDPYTTLQEVIDNSYLNLRTGMVSRSATFEPVYYYYEGKSQEDTNYEAIADAVIQLYDKALEHTGQPNEGDYIRQNLENIYAYQVSSSATISGGTYYWTHKITFNPTYRSTAPQEATVDTALDEAIAGLNLEGMGDYDKAKAVHDYVCGHVTYDTSLTKYATYNAVVDGTSVCQGYSSMLYNMMLRAGIDCRVITGTANNGSGAEGHAWNIVKIDGVWYNIDATWDDPVGATPTILDKFFLLSDVTIESDDYGTHTRGNGIKEGKKVAIDYTHGSDFDKAYPVSLLDYSAFKGVSGAVNESIVMYLLYDFPASLVADENAKIRVTFPRDGDKYGTFSYEMPLSEGIKDGDHYKYPCTVPSPRMTDVIQVQVVSGEKQSPVREFSFKDYCMTLLNSPGLLSESQTTYVTAMLNLGAYAQLYFGYQTNDLANADVTDNVKSVVPSVAMAEMSGTTGRMRPFVRPTANEGVSYVGSSLVINSTISIRHYYKVDDPSDLSKLTFKLSNIDETVSGKLKSGTNDTVYVETEPYTARSFDTNTCNVTVYKDGTKVMVFAGPTSTSAFPGYNVYNYVYNYFEGIKDGNLQDGTPMANLAKAFYLYAKAANQVY